MNKIKSFFRRKGAQVGTALVAVTSVLPMAGASGSELPEVDTSGVVTAITTAAESVKTRAYCDWCRHWRWYRVLGCPCPLE